MKHCGYCGTAFATLVESPAQCGKCDCVSRTLQEEETGWLCQQCYSGGGPMKQAYCIHCGAHISARKGDAKDSEEESELARLVCIQNMLLIEVLKFRWALDTGNRDDRPTLDQLDRYSRDAILHEHPHTKEQHAFQFWCPTTMRQYDIGDLNRCPRCLVFEHQLRED